MLSAKDTTHNKTESLCTRSTRGSGVDIHINRYRQYIVINNVIKR